MQNEILLVEDSKEIFNLVDRSITGPLLKCDWAENFEQAQKKMKAKNYDMYLIDITLPDGNGLELCREVQQRSPQTPVFLLTAHDQTSEKVMGFSAGADDYITKPFDSVELKARVEARLRKSEIQKVASDRLDWDDLKINKSSQEVQVRNEQGDLEKIDLTGLEYKILLFLANRPNEVVDRDTMLNEVWGEDIHVYSRSVDTHVSKLRKKLGSVAELIESVHGAGYKFTDN